MSKRNIKIISGILSAIGLIAPFIADCLDGSMIEDQVEEKVNEILKKKGVISEK